jgi:alpha-galactosidase
VALFNSGSSTTTVSTTAAAVGKAGSSFSLRDLWTNAVTTTGGTISAGVAAHGTVVYRVSGGATSSGSSFASAASSRCLDDPMSATTNGTQPIIWDCSGAANQRWAVGGGAIRVLGKCLDAPIGANPGAKVQLWDCNGGSNQQWTVNTDGTVGGVASGLCLDVTGNATANGTLTDLSICGNAANQRWARL